jgi:hypothetical protein
MSYGLNGLKIPIGECCKSQTVGRNKLDVAIAESSVSGKFRSLPEGLGMLPSPPESEWRLSTLSTRRITPYPMIWKNNNI